MIDTTEDKLRFALQATFSPARLEIINESYLHAGHREAGNGADTHFRVRITSEALAGLSKVAQHRAIYQAAAAFMPVPIHALAIEVLSI